MKVWLKRHYRQVLMQGLFIILSLCFISPMLIHGYIPNGDDWGYHINRIWELTENIRHGNFFPQIYTYTFDQIGYPLNSFYPWLTLLPFALLKLIIPNQVIAIALGFALYIYLGLNIAYHIAKKVVPSNQQAFWTALTYMFAGYIMVDVYRRMAMGEFLSLIFVPLVLYGIYAILWGNYRHWPYLAFGLSLVMLSHVLSVYMLTIACAILFVIALCRRMTPLKQRLFAIGKSILVFITSSAIFLLPFLQQQTYQAFNQPSPTAMGDYALPLGTLITYTLNFSNVRVTCGFLTLIILLFGAIQWRHLSRFERICYMIGTLLLLATTNMIPWYTFDHIVPINIIQFPFRLNMFITVFYAIVGGKLAYLAIAKVDNMTTKKWAVIGLIGFIVIPTIANANELMRARAKNVDPTTLFTKDASFYSGLDGLWLDQYTPKTGQDSLPSVEKHIAILDQDQMVTPMITSEPNKLIYSGINLNDAHDVDLPIFYYKNIVIYRDGKRVTPTKSDRHTIRINTKQTGPITVKYQPSALDIIAIISSLGTWCIAIIIWVIKKNKHTIHKRGYVQ